MYIPIYYTLKPAISPTYIHTYSYTTYIHSYTLIHYIHTYMLTLFYTTSIHYSSRAYSPHHTHVYALIHHTHTIPYTFILPSCSPYHTPTLRITYIVHHRVYELICHIPTLLHPHTAPVNTLHPPTLGNTYMYNHTP